MWPPRSKQALPSPSAVCAAVKWPMFVVICLRRFIESFPITDWNCDAAGLRVLISVGHKGHFIIFYPQKEQSKGLFHAFHMLEGCIHTLI